MKDISAQSIYNKIRKEENIMNKEKIIEYLKEHPNITKGELYNAFPCMNHSTLGKYYNNFKYVTKFLESTKELLLSELKEETRRFKGFRNMVNDYAKKNNINVIWKGTFPSLKESERHAFCLSIEHKPSFSNKDPTNPYFYKEMYGLTIWKFKQRDTMTKVRAISCNVSGKEFKILFRNNEDVKTIPINPLETKDWHLNHLQDVFKWLIL